MADEGREELMGMREEPQVTMEDRLGRRKIWMSQEHHRPQQQLSAET